MMMNPNFRLGYERRNSDITGLFPNKFNQSLLSVDFLQWSYPDHRQESHPISLLMFMLFERPAIVYTKTLPTLIDGLLKIGGLLGFIKLFSYTMNFIH